MPYIFESSKYFHIHAVCMYHYAFMPEWLAILGKCCPHLFTSGARKYREVGFKNRIAGLRSTSFRLTFDWIVSVAIF